MEFMIACSRVSAARREIQYVQAAMYHFVYYIKILLTRRSGPNTRCKMRKRCLSFMALNNFQTGLIWLTFLGGTSLYWLLLNSRWNKVLCMFVKSKVFFIIIINFYYLFPFRHLGFYFSLVGCSSPFIWDQGWVLSRWPIILNKRMLTSWE